MEEWVTKKGVGKAIIFHVIVDQESFSSLNTASSKVNQILVFDPREGRNLRYKLSLPSHWFLLHTDLFNSHKAAILEHPLLNIAMGELSEKSANDGIWWNKMKMKTEVGRLNKQINANTL